MLTTLVLLMTFACGGEEGDANDNAAAVEQQAAPVEVFQEKFKAKIDRGVTAVAFAAVVSEVKGFEEEDAWLLMVSVGVHAPSESLSEHLDKLGDKTDKISLSTFLIHLFRKDYDAANAVADTESNSERAKGMRTLAGLMKGSLSGDVYTPENTAEDWLAKWAIASVAKASGNTSVAIDLFTELASDEGRAAKLQGLIGLAHLHTDFSARIENAEKALAMALEINDIVHIGVASSALAKALGATDQGSVFDEKLKAVFDVQDYLSKSDLVVVGVGIAEGLNANGDYYMAHQLLKGARTQLPDGDLKNKIAWSEA